MHSTDIKTVGSVVSELKTSLRNVLAWYGTLVRLVRIFKQRTNVSFSYLHKRVPFFLAKIEAYRTYVPYRTALFSYKPLDPRFSDRA